MFSEGRDTGAQSASASISDTRRAAPGRLLVVSHPAVVSVNQEVYRELARRGWTVSIVLPSRWRHDYADGDIAPQPLPGMESSLIPTPVLLRGRPQRHLYLTRPRAVRARLRPDVAFLEAEPFALAAAQWGFALHRLGVPFGVQCYENIDRALPAPIRAMRARVLRDAAFVAARSPSAAALARAWGARGEVAIAPPAVPGWERTDPTTTEAPSGDAAERPFTVGFAGRLIEAKGLLDLLAAVRDMHAPVALELYGEGALRGALEGQEIPGGAVRVIDGVGHAQMASAYARLDALVVPSHTTPRWKEQFGRVIIEALYCGVPVVGSDSGEIPWLLETTGGGLVFAEGDVQQLTARLEELRADPALRTTLAERGRAAVDRMFTVPAATDPLERMLGSAMNRARCAPAPSAPS